MWVIGFSEFSFYHQRRDAELVSGSALSLAPCVRWGTMDAETSSARQAIVKARTAQSAARAAGGAWKSRLEVWGALAYRIARDQGRKPR
jgi:hypothetical protein